MISLTIVIQHSQLALFCIVSENKCFLSQNAAEVYHEINICIIYLNICIYSDEIILMVVVFTLSGSLLI